VRASPSPRRSSRLGLSPESRGPAGDPRDWGPRVGVAAFVLTVVGLNLPRCVLMLLEGPSR